MITKSHQTSPVLGIPVSVMFGDAFHFGTNAFRFVPVCVEQEFARGSRVHERFGSEKEGPFLLFIMKLVRFFTIPFGFPSPPQVSCPIRDERWRAPWSDFGNFPR
jgi:hypothetical protein